MSARGPGWALPSQRGSSRRMGESCACRPTPPTALHSRSPSRWLSSRRPSEERRPRMRAGLRRRSEDGDGPVRVGDLEIDLADRAVRRGGDQVHLTPIEFDLLSQLAQHPGRLVTHRQLLQEVWGPGYEDETHY